MVKPGFIFGFNYKTNICVQTIWCENTIMCNLYFLFPQVYKHLCIQIYSYITVYFKGIHLLKQHFMVHKYGVEWCMYIYFSQCHSLQYAYRDMLCVFRL